MKFVLIAFAFISVTAAAQLPDSATQGPNPQDIATPEPEYIDIDLPEPPRSAAISPVSSIIPAVQSRSNFIPLPRPIQSPIQNYISPQRSHQTSAHHSAAGHVFSGQSGYQYRRPVYIRRVYRRHY